MAKIPEGVMGPIRGKVGTVVGVHWKGETYIRASFKRRSKKRGKIEKHNQQNFSMLHNWLRPLLPFLREGFRDYAPRVHGFNAAKSFALKNALVGEKGSKVFDPSKMQVSYGELPLPSHMHCEKEGQQVRFYWDREVPTGANAFDQAMLLLYHDKTRSYQYKLTGQFRNVGEDVLDLPKERGTYHVYLAFTSNDRRRNSHSVYLGEVKK